MADILEVRHVERGPYVTETHIIWNGGVNHGAADEAARAIETADSDKELGFDLLYGPSAEQEQELEDARREAKEAQERIEELEQEASEAETAKGEAENERDEALDKLDGFMKNAGWKVERERKFEELEADSKALNTLCTKLHWWAGRSKAKADALRFIDEARVQIKALRDEIAEKYEGREEEERKAA
jgi:multidrug efflux pump subunit AcrA (membrane-fusion protein)